MELRGSHQVDERLREERGEKSNISSNEQNERNRYETWVDEP